MNDFVPEPPPTWTPEVQSVFDKFIQSGGSRETWAAANPELIPPSAPAQPAKRATHPADSALLNWTRAAFNYSAAKAIAGMRKSQRGRQGR